MKILSAKDAEERQRCGSRAFQMSASRERERERDAF